MLKQLLCCAALSALWAAAPMYGAPDVPAAPAVKEAAEIGAEKITQEEIFAQMSQGLGEGILNLRDSNPTQFAQYYKLYRDQIVGMKLLANEAVKHEKELLEDAQIKEQLEQMKRNFLVNAYVVQYVKKRSTPEALQDAFKKNPQEMVKLSRIVVDDEKKAKSIIVALKTRSFADLAAQYSKDKQSGKDGALPPILLARLNGRLRAHVMALKKGGHSAQPFEMDGKWYILKLDDRMKANFKQAEPVLNDLVAMKELQTLMASLRAKEKVKLFDLDGKETTDSLLTMAPGASNTAKPAAAA
jgi:parvulin-like peptidyl-prolyl isomerase